MTAELRTRGRGEMLARTWCDVAEVQLRGARQQLSKLRDKLGRDGARREPRHWVASCSQI